MQSIVIAGMGHAVPEKILKNEDFVKMGVDTSDEWIRTRTGIHERHIAEKGETLLQLSKKASLIALKNARVDPKEVELIVFATLTPDMPMPSMACLLGDELGMNGCGALDVSAACSGFIYGLSVAEGLMRARGYRTAMVVGGEKLSAATDWTDRNTCVLFGDGVGVAVLKAIDEPGFGITDALLGADGSAKDLLKLEHGGFIQMNGKEVFKIAVKAMGEGCEALLKRNSLAKENIALLIPHQANNRIIEAIAERLKIPMERFFVNVSRYGNTSSASIPIALSEALSAGRLKRGDKLVLVAFGGGLTWGAMLLKWY